jgi:hypothetical protein
MRWTSLSRSGRHRGGVRLAPVAVALSLAALLVSAWAGPAAAHEAKRVGGYRMVVGFGDEPAYAGQKNSAQLLLSDAAGKPVTDLGDTLKVMVMTGNQSQDLALEPNFEVGEFGTPGDYRAYFLPSTPGGFTFHFHGTIKGQKVVQDFKSGPGSFGDVVDPARASFPKLSQPTTAQIAQRVDRETARLGGSAQAAMATATAADHRVRQTATKVTILSIMGPIGLVLGLFGMVMTGIALRTAKRALAASSRPPLPFHQEALRDSVEV